MGLNDSLKEEVFHMIDEHLSNVRTLIACTDTSEKKFKEQLQSEFRYFSNLKRYFDKDQSVPVSKILILEDKLEHYKNTNQYRYNIAKKIIELNNSYEESEVPF